MEKILQKIEELMKKIRETSNLLGIKEKELRITNYELRMNKEGFWNNQSEAAEVGKTCEDLKKEVGEWRGLEKELDDLRNIINEAIRENDLSMCDDFESKFSELENIFASLEFYILFSGKYDENNAIITIHSGTGGVDAQDWSQILERMFMRFAERKGFKAEMLDRTVGTEAGIKNSSFLVRGRYAYGNFRSEAGMHRLVRISPFDAEAMRHTSFSLVEVIPELPDTEELNIDDKDLKIDVYRSSGPGGQGVNTTDSAVRITHLPTKITVSCQNERSQHQNRETAMKIIRSKLLKLELDKRDSEERKLRGETQTEGWGKQIRSYVLQPYKMVKDHRTEHETSDTDAVLDGDLTGFIEAYLRVTHNA